MATSPTPIFDTDQTVRVIAEHLGDDGRKELVAAATDVWTAQIPADERSAHYARIVATLDVDLVGQAAAAQWGAGSDLSIMTDAFEDLDPDEQEDELRSAAVLRACELFEAGAELDVVLDTVLPWLDARRMTALRDEALRIYASTNRGCDN